MLTAEHSPVHRLAESWFREERKPSPFQVPKLRKKLLQAGLAQIREHERLGHNYNPFCDRRYLWATQYLNAAVDPSDPIDPNLHHLVGTMYFTSDPLHWNKSDAANDH